MNENLYKTAQKGLIVPIRSRRAKDREIIHLAEFYLHNWNNIIIFAYKNERTAW